MTEPTGPTLTDAKGLGGVIAQDGFDYQVWDALARLPAWLRSPAFEGFVIEGLEDVETRFFAPLAPDGRFLDRYQAKSGNLSRSDILEVLTSFRRFDAVHPKVARLQTLVTPQLPPTLTWIARDPGRVRGARPFYSPFDAVWAASDDKLRADLVDEFGDDVGGYFADAVEVDLRPIVDRRGAEVAFGAALHAAVPELDVGARALTAAFSALNDLAAQSRGVMLTRERLFDLLRANLGVDLAPDKRLRVHLRSDRNEAAEDAIEIDAGAFSGAGGGFPPEASWAAGLLEPLERTARWARQQGQQRLWVTGSYRLTTAFAVGWSFRSAIGFELDIATRAGPWSTDAHPPPGSAGPAWSITQPDSLVSGRLVVGVGVLRDPRPDVEQSLGIGPDQILALSLEEALVDSVSVQASVQAIKAAVAQAAARLGASGIDLYYVGPAGLAVALGHRWNGLPATQLNEFVAVERRYVKTAVLPPAAGV